MTKMFDSLVNSQVQLDTAAGDAAKLIEANGFDAQAFNHQVQLLRQVALAVLLVFADDIISNDLDDDELPSDRFGALIGGFSADSDGEESDVDEATSDIITANIQDAMYSLGADSSLVDAAFGDDVAEADQALVAIAETVESNIPQGEEAEQFISEFVFGGDDDNLLDAATVGKTTAKKGKFGNIIYKAVKAVRNGKITVVNKRVHGKVRLSAKQKASLAKARVKAFSSSAMKQRLRSFTKGKKAGIY